MQGELRIGVKPFWQMSMWRDVSREAAPVYTRQYTN
ncbi:hypothetical protein LAUMK41_02664 [Mycobacterium attenuatum]|nr:hypothetical protein LAUMK41_02664 [Mycobacterium attenuatum]